ncbi:MSMEG_0565 family glycosyltransferase [Methylorubrum extorquens]|jgi:glycosyltransferase-like protein|uniref:Glycosyl transferase, group 1 n=1 Tax=Methylorubrum extorquens (strain ATCC 14718 / DSM 1338 / JCM 2805 / NCIMB 9133 / AM1) TaxID=272630 RepID=C5APJ0_METEA|nr:MULTISPECIES: MSMEG_0565 family glycosyltransferase [Methylorubrum]ACS38216.1 Glycosyl transferase, group 1 [Methylorubrum extorquens AM1]MCP1543740.1 glycosyltransferase-like protein [Methylorubrum extorquens]MCP1588914.1 glycosyltransferase-like protein [Methylorubrum extorquens]BDL37745.1 glycosyl transferase family 1 [Methylorubrum sp. GM97]
MTALRIAILTHSTNPRGGVAHCLALAEALCALGHEAVVHAPDPAGRGFFRNAACTTVSVAAEPVKGATVDLVRARINDYLRHFSTPAACDFDVFHAHDGIGGNALATLKRRRLIPGFVRTVHHVDSFSDPLLAEWQDRSIREATRLLCVSRTWADWIRDDLGAEADIVGNGVDLSVFRSEPTEADAAVRERWGLGQGPVILSVGGFEERKNALGIIEAIARLRARYSQAQLVVAGGVSLLDHATYRARCRSALAAAGLTVGRGAAVIETGPVPQAVLPALYRVADALAFPSWKEGFGLCVLEAMACGTPAIVSRRPPFTEYLAATDALFVDPADPDAIAAAMAEALATDTRARLRAAGQVRVVAHSWRACAERNLNTYAACARTRQEPMHA